MRSPQWDLARSLLLFLFVSQTYLPCRGDDGVREVIAALARLLETIKVSSLGSVQAPRERVIVGVEATVEVPVDIAVAQVGAPLSPTPPVRA